MKNVMITPHEQTDVAGAGGEERLQRGVGVGLLLPPVPDEHERAQADELPADEQLQRVVGDDEQQHRRGEQARARRRSRCSGGRRACTRVEYMCTSSEIERDDEHHHHRETVDLDADA